MIVSLAYHSVSSKDYLYSISKERFEKQLLYLKKKFKIVSSLELADMLSNGQMPKENIAVITFDDGLEDNYQEAWPILKKHSVPATIFMTTELVDGSIVNNRGYSFHFLDDRQLKEMANDPLITFGSHTHTHRLLATLSSEQIKNEFEKSNQIMDALTSQKMQVISYPKGSYNDEVKKIAKKYYTLAFGALGVISSKKDIDLFNIPRILVYNSDPDWKFRLKLSRIYNYLRKFKK